MNRSRMVGSRSSRQAWSTAASAACSVRPRRRRSVGVIEVPVERGRGRAHHGLTFASDPNGGGGAAPRQQLVVGGHRRQRPGVGGSPAITAAGSRRRRSVRLTTRCPATGCRHRVDGPTSAPLRGLNGLGVAAGLDGDHVGATAPTPARPRSRVTSSAGRCGAAAAPRSAHGCRPRRREHARGGPERLVGGVNTPAVAGLGQRGGAGQGAGLALQDLQVVVQHHAAARSGRRPADGPPRPRGRRRPPPRRRAADPDPAPMNRAGTEYLTIRTVTIAERSTRGFSTSPGSNPSSGNGAVGAFAREVLPDRARCGR